MKKLIASLIAVLLILTFYSCGKNTNEIMSATIESKAYYDNSLDVVDLNTLDITSGGASILFRTEGVTEDLILEWFVYPSDIMSTANIYSLDGLLHEGIIKTYPEGGTVYYRITQGALLSDNYRGTKWFRLDLPRSTKGILPPPYAPVEIEEK